MLTHKSAGHDPTGRPILLIHGGAEDASMLTAQAEAIASRGRRVIWYDRRGTGGSTRTGWPGSGADQHADDGAALLREVAATPARVVGFSSGGIVALALAARHTDLVAEVITWEAPVVTLLPDGLTVHAQLMAPVEKHLRANPQDWTGAYRVMLHTTSGGTADLDAPLVRRAMANAEAIVRDDGPLITRRQFRAGELPADRITVAIGAHADAIHVAIADRLAELLGRPYARITGVNDHEVYLSQPEVLADWLAAR